MYLLSTIPFLFSLLNALQLNFCHPPLCKAVRQGHLQVAQTSAHLSVLLAFSLNGDNKGAPSYLLKHFLSLGFQRILTGDLYLNYQSSSISFGGSSSYLWALSTEIPKGSVIRFLLFLHLFPSWSHLAPRHLVPSTRSHLPHLYPPLEPAYHLPGRLTSIKTTLLPPLKPLILYLLQLNAILDVTT